MYQCHVLVLKKIITDLYIALPLPMLFMQCCHDIHDIHYSVQTAVNILLAPEISYLYQELSIVDLQIYQIVSLDQ